MNALIQRMDIMPAEEERAIVHALVDSIEIHPKPLPSGLILKKICFRIPLDWDGYDSPIIGLDITDDDSDSGGSLPSGGNPPPGGAPPSDGTPPPAGGTPPSGGTPPPDKESLSGTSPQPDDSQTPNGDLFFTDNSLPKPTSVPSLSRTVKAAPAKGFLVTASRLRIVRLQRGSS